MSAVAQPHTPPAVQGNIIALYTQGTSKRSIARELGVSRNTIDNILRRYNQDLRQVEPSGTTRVQRVLPLAYDAVEKAIKSGDARIAMDLLKLELSHRGATVYNVAGDLAISTAVGLVPASTPSTASSPGTQPALAAPTEAPAKAATQGICLASHENFSQFSTAELEQELARRKAAAAPVIDAEVVGG